MVTKTHARPRPGADPGEPSQGHPRRVALTGARTFLGSQLIRRLEADPRCEHILALDIAPPPTAGPKTRFVRLDLTHPKADRRAAAALHEDGIAALAHLAFLSKPSHSTSWAHELEAIGTLYTMNAAAHAKVPRVVLGSSAMTYGAFPDNPQYLTEAHPLRGNRASRWVRDRVAAERELAKLDRDCPRIHTTTLRFATVLGPRIRSFHTRFYQRDVLPRLMGYDPLMQFVHEDDAVEALYRAVVEEHPGAYNVAGDGVLYFSAVPKLGGRLSFVTPHGLAYPLAAAAFNLQLVGIPSTFLNYFRYTWVTDNRRMREELGVQPRFTSRAVVEAFYAAEAGARPPGDTGDGASAQEVHA